MHACTGTANLFVVVSLIGEKDDPNAQIVVQSARRLSELLLTDVNDYVVDVVCDEKGDASVFFRHRDIDIRIAGAALMNVMVNQPNDLIQ